MEEKIEIADLFELPLFSAPAAHPLQAAELLYVKTQVAAEKNAYLASIVLLNQESGEERELIAPTSRNYAPQWAPDGRSFLFLSDRSGKAQVYTYDLASQVTTQQTFTQAGVDHLLWHPDGEHFYFGTVTALTSETLTWATAATTAATALPTAYITEDLRYKMNGRGLLTSGEGDVWCFQALGAATATVVCDYNQGYGLKTPADISPDGQYLAIERRLALHDPFNFDSGVFLLNLATQVWTQTTPATGAFGEPCFAPDSRSLALIGNPLPYLTSNEFRVFHYDVTEATFTPLLAEEDVQVTDFGVSDFKILNTNRQIQWSADGRKILFVVSVEGRVALFSVSPTTLVVTYESYELEHIVDFHVTPTADKVLLSVTSPSEPALLVALDLTTTTRRTLKTSGVTKAWARYEKVDYHAADGGRVPGFVAWPATQTEAKVPLILNIHGGPYTMHTATFHHEVQVMTSAGYAVLLLNPRGSFGYGQKHIDGVINRYGKEDYTDLLSGLDQLVAAHPEIDQEQLYVTGGSYGGYLTNWIVAHDQRFRAAATQRSMVNLVSMVGTSDNGYFFNVSESGADITKPHKLWDESPLAYVAQIETPLLILHSEEDYRCPMEQAEQLFVALKYLGKEARFVRFPHSNHELSRTGLPNLRVTRLTEIMNWFARYAN